MAWPMVAQAQSPLPKSALEYTLQRPAVVKHFDHKRFGDHLFLQAGAGISDILGGGNDMYHVQRPGVQGDVMIGDWWTPEHGLRLGFSAGYNMDAGRYVKFGGVSLDYMMNITALGAADYKVRRPVELYGIVGVETEVTRLAGNNDVAPGIRFGLQGNVRLSDYTYFYIEPRIGLYDDAVAQTSEWRHYRPKVSLTAGLGYNMLSGQARSGMASPYRTFTDGLFLSMGGGPSIFLHDIKHLWRYNGARARVSLGKWFSPLSAVRLSAGLSYYSRGHGLNGRMKGFDGQLDYMLNLNNAFAGYSPFRRFDLSAVAGLDMAVTSANGISGDQWAYGVGGGVHANWFVNRARNLALFLEPRLDLMSQKYIGGINTVSKVDAVASLMAGITILRRPAVLPVKQMNEQFHSAGFLDHTFIEAGAGVSALAKSAAVDHPGSYVKPKVYAAVGKWLDAISGVRLSVEYSKYKVDDKHSYNLFDGGADYLFNISNVLNGYNPARTVELIGDLGPHLVRRTGVRHLFFGVGGGLQALWHVSPLFGLYLEPQLHFYDNAFAPGDAKIVKADAVASLMAGIQVNINGYDPQRSREAYLADEDSHGFVSLALGGSGEAYHLRGSDAVGPVGRFSFGRQYSTSGAWRVNAMGYERKVGNHRFARAAVGADYILDLSSMQYGYNPDRVVSLRALTGAYLAMDYFKGTTYCAPEIHVGGQLAFRVAPRVELYLEPQLGYNFHDDMGSVSQRSLATMLFGANYYMRSSSSKAGTIADEGRHFVSLGIGSGSNTQTLRANHPFGRKLTFDADVAYGQWANAVSGLRIGLHNETLQQMGRAANINWLTLHADYLMNLNSLLFHGQMTDDAVRFILGLGVTGNVAAQQGYKPRFAPGLAASFETDVRLTDHLDLFVEPTVNMTTCRINKYVHAHPFEGNVNLLVGTKFRF